VEHQIQRVVGEIIGKGARDPRIGFVSVMGVDVTPDLKNAHIHVSVYGSEEEVAKTLEGLESARSFIQRELASALRLRYSPKIFFHRDDSIAYTMKVEEMLGSLRREDGQLPADDDEDTEETPGTD